MGYSEEAVKFTDDIIERAHKYGFPLVGIVSAEQYDAYPGHYIGHRDYECDTGKTGDYMDGAKSLIILGVQVWDSLFDMVIKVEDHHEYPDEWRGRYYARRMMRHLDSLGYRTELEPDLLSKKRMAQMSGIGSFGKQSLIVNPEFGPWLRLRSVLTDAELVPTGPVIEDQCGECDECIKACPVGALSPYKVDYDKCLLGLKWEDRMSDEFKDIYLKHSPMLTESTWLMCNTCQKACPIGHDLRFEVRERSPSPK